MTGTGLRSRPDGATAPRAEWRVGANVVRRARDNTTLSARRLREMPSRAAVEG